MELTYTGIALLALFAFVMLRVPNGTLYLLAFFVPFGSTAIVNVPASTFSATPYHVLGSILVGLALLRWTSTPLNGDQLDLRSPFFWMMAFVAMLLASMFSLALTTGLGFGVVVQSVILLLGFLVSWAVAQRITGPDVARRAVVIYLWGGLFAAAWGVFQWLCLNLGLTYPSEIFNNSISEAAALFDQALKDTPFVLYRVSSVSFEPSSLARFLISVLVIAVVLIGEGIGRVPFGRWYIYLVSGVIVLSTSTTGLIGLAIVFPLTLLLYGRRFLRDISVIAVAGTAILLISPEVASIASKVTLEKGESGSFDVRMTSMFDGFRAFTDAPLFGHGWGWFKSGTESVLVNDLIFKFLSSVGLFGFTLFAIYVALGVLGAWGAAARIGARLRRPGLSEEERATGDFLRAAALAVMLALLVCLFLDTLASFFYYGGIFWFMFGTMVGLSRVATTWESRCGQDGRLPVGLGANQAGPGFTSAARREGG
jgi:hypothetical protein